MKLPSSSRSGLILAMFALGSAALLAVVHELTDESIEEAQRRAKMAALHEILPQGIYDNDVLTDTIRINDRQWLGTDEPVTVYRARKGGQPVAVVMEVVAPDGYSGPIRMLVGIRFDGTLAGVRVTEHQETPGLGDKLDTDVDDWILQFEGLSLRKPPRDHWALEEDGGVFDQFTGASITPRAVIKAIKKALLYFSDHKAELFNQTGSDDTTDPR